MSVHVRPTHQLRTRKQTKLPFFDLTGRGQPTTSQGWRLTSPLMRRNRLHFHLYFSIINSLTLTIQSTIIPRSMRVLSLFSSIFIMLFVQSVTYNIADPDDGSCEACRDENRCLSLRLTLNSNEGQCYWCQYNSRREGPPLSNHP
jgi:hypothetical protein